MILIMMEELELCKSRTTNLKDLPIGSKAANLPFFV